MNFNERKDSIMENLRQQTILYLPALKELLQVSEVTIRKDLEELEKEGCLKRIRGGAILQTAKPAESISKEIVNLEAKRIIADLALSLIEKQDTIFLGTGSSCYVLGTMLPTEQAISVVTNNVSASIDMQGNTSNNLLIGGEIACHKGLFYTETIDAFNNYGGVSVNRAFVGLDGIDLNAGFTTNFLYCLQVYQHVPRIARQFIVLADHTKFNKIALHQAFGQNMPEYVICDQYLPEYDAFFLERNIKYLHP